MLEFVANEINKTPRICDAFHKDVNTFNSFFQSINGGSNTLLLEPTVNSAVNELFTAGNSLGAGASQKTKVRQLLCYPIDNCMVHFNHRMELSVI